MEKKQKSLSEFEDSLVRLSGQHEAALRTGSVEQAFQIAGQLQQVKEQIRDLQKQGNHAET